MGSSPPCPASSGSALHSPRLDERGNSVRGVAACERLSSELGLHLLLPSERPRTGLRRSYRGDTVRSTRTRGRQERDVLEAEGSSIAVSELDGDQGFASTELLVRLVIEDPVPAGWRVLDLRRVTRIDRAAVILLRGLAERLAAEDVALCVVEPRMPGPRAVAREIGPDLRYVSDAEVALEWCETALLRSRGIEEALPEGLVPMADQDLLHGLASGVVEAIAERTVTRVFTPGAVIFDEGDASDGLYFVGAGQVSVDVRVRRPPGRRRLSTIAAGSSFGELALVDGRTRSTRIASIEPTICYVLTPDAYADLEETDPAACAQLTLAIARSLSTRLRYSTADVAALEEA